MAYLKFGRGNFGVGPYVRAAEFTTQSPDALNSWTTQSDLIADGWVEQIDTPVESWTIYKQVLDANDN